MKLIIDIDEEIYNYIHNEHIAIRVCDSHKVAKAIATGTILPKGHGDLKDVSKLLTVTDIRSDGSETTYVFYDEIEDAPTIIEADKGESEEV